jgi:hypothetical protein
MAELLCVGVTHAPMFGYSDDHMADILRSHLASDRVPADQKDPRNWPEQMAQEFGPNGENAIVMAAQERERVIGAYREVRRAIDEFEPDVVLIWGDDQYENFQEDLIPPFCVYACAEYETQPLLRAPWALGEPTNIWNEPRDKTFATKGHPAAGRQLARRLLEEDRAVAYAYKPGLHKPGLAHAFMNTFMYLDYDRTGFDYPLLPFHVNCYGSDLVRNRGGFGIGQEMTEPDPPAPSPRLCFEMGAATARIMAESPWRTVLIGSSSWSHAFLTAKNYFLYPDVVADRRRYEELCNGNQHLWREIALGELEASGQAEFLNWVCLAGAMTEVGAKAEVLDFSDSYIFNSSKCTMLARPAAVAADSGTDVGANGQAAGPQ